MNRIVAAAAPFCVLAACSGGGGGGVGAPPPPVVVTPGPTPAPSPSPPPPPVSADTEEYRATVGAVSMNALSAYQRGATGAGIGIGIIDTGIDLESEEFGGRISAASADVAGGGRTIDDESGHGTAVAFTAAGRRNGAGTHGVAFEATVIALRADRPGTCAAPETDDSKSPCRFGTDAIARGVDAARTGGARVINISLGGSDMPANLRAAIGRATAAGLVVVIAAGNDGTTEPDAFAAVANDAATARGQVIIAGWVDGADVIDDDSDRAGSSAAVYLAAVGTRVRAPDKNNTPLLWSGTSFAAPQISGAVALLAQAFPNLSGAQIVDILFRTARDAGAPGTDPIYGRGVLDLTRAFQPLGATRVAGTALGTPLTGRGAALSAPMGDAGVGPMGAVILDGYGRAFATDLAHIVNRAAPLRPMGGALLARGRHVAVAAGGTAVSVSLTPRPGGGVLIERTSLSRADADAARAIAGTVTQRLGSRLQFGFGMRQGSGALAAQLTGAREPAFLVAGADGLGFEGGARRSGAVRRTFGRLGVTAAGESGVVLSPREDRAPGAGAWDRSGFDRASLSLDRRFGALSTRLTGSRLDERSTVLGARFDPSLGGAAATSWFVDAGARLELGAWTLGAGLRQGWTKARLGGLSGGGRLRTGAFDFDVGRDGVFGDDTLGLRVAQPLRVASGGIDVALPTLWDYASGEVATWTTQRMNLAPTGRELDLELRYGRRLWGGDLHWNLFWRRDPGHHAALPDDRGIAVRFQTGF